MAWKNGHHARNEPHKKCPRLARGEDNDRKQPIDFKDNTMNLYLPRWVYTTVKWVLLLEASAATALLIDWWWGL